MRSSWPTDGVQSTGRLRERTHTPRLTLARMSHSGPNTAQSSARTSSSMATGVRAALNSDVATRATSLAPAKDQLPAVSRTLSNAAALKHAGSAGWASTMAAD